MVGRNWKVDGQLWAPQLCCSGGWGLGWERGFWSGEGRVCSFLGLNHQELGCFVLEFWEERAERYC